MIQIVLQTNAAANKHSGEKELKIENNFTAFHLNLKCYNGKVFGELNCIIQLEHRAWNIICWTWNLHSKVCSPTTPTRISFLPEEGKSSKLSEFPTTEICMIDCSELVTHSLIQACIPSIEHEKVTKEQKNKLSNADN